MNKFSVLISVYEKEKASILDETFTSIYNQTLKADDVVVVKDGPLTDELEKILEKWKKLLPLHIFGYDKNMGAGYALERGVPMCKYDVIIKVDSDDISLEDRFDKQVRFLDENKDISLVGGQIKEFHKTPTEKGRIRRVPLEHSKIIKYLKKRNAFSHMSVAYRKAAVLDSGNYITFIGWEDYYLWVRMILKGYKTANLSDVLVYARVGNDMVGRRVGVQYAKKEVEFYKKLLELKFITKFEFIQVVLMRVPFRFLPKGILELVYKFIRKFM